jgi:hypothetical protein
MKKSPNRDERWERFDEKDRTSSDIDGRPEHKWHPRSHIYVGPRYERTGTGHLLSLYST